MNTYVFPGQGSQSKGMGSGLFDEFADYISRANKVLGYDLKRICLENPDDQLNQTNYTQPALFVVNALSYLKKLAENKEPHYVAGHSLGEYNALFAAHVFDFETGLQLVQKRGELMSQSEGGGMAAVIGLTESDVEKIILTHELNDLSIANYNSYTQIVITGPKESIVKAKSIFENAGANLFIPLNVSGAFHSRYMMQAQQIFSEFINQFKFSPPQFPVIANVNAQPYRTDSQAIANSLTQQITSPVRWTQSIAYLIEQGEKNFEEIGPGKVLTGLIKRIQRGQ